MFDNSEIKLAIPSYKRSKNVITLESIPVSYKKNTFLFVRPEEFNCYKHYDDRCNIIKLSDTCLDIGSTRQFIINFFENEKIWMLDDDISIHKSNLSYEKYQRYNTYWYVIRSNKENITENEFYSCLSLINNYMKTFYHGHLRLPLFPKGKSFWPARFNTYGFTNTFYDLSKIPKSLINYEKMDLCEDMYVFLNLIDNGFDRIAISEYQVKSSKPNAPGGCSEYRTIENHNRALEKIHQLFPKFTKWSDREYNLNLSGKEAKKALKVVIKNSGHISTYQKPAQLTDFL
jgi:uncharacterized ubiquitin-like protein YukD